MEISPTNHKKENPASIQQSSEWVGEPMADVIKRFCVEQGLDKFKMPLSEDDLNKMRAVPQAATLWSDRSGITNPHIVLSEYVDELVDHRNPGNYVVFGLSGGGVMTGRCLYLFEVEEQFAFFGEMNWGAQNKIKQEDAANAMSFAKTVFACCRNIKAKVIQAVHDGKIPLHGKRLLAVYSNQGGKTGKCAWVDANTNQDNIQWQQITRLQYPTPEAVAVSMLNQLPKSH